jgi:hypothetical protein
MTENCITCGGKMAHYLMPPRDYCLRHENWMDKCASVEDDCITYSDIKVAMLIPEEGYFICPTDGTMKEAASTVIPSSLLHPKHWGEGEAPSDLKDVTKHAVGLMETGAVSSGTMDALPNVPGQKAYDFFKGHMEQSKAIKTKKKVQDLAAMFPQGESAKSLRQETAAVDVKKIIPTLDDSYDKAHNYKADEALKEKADVQGTTPEHLVAVNKARDYVVKNMDGTPAIGYLATLPEKKRFEVARELSNSPINNMDGLYHELRDSIGLGSDNMGLTAEASIQKEAMWYYLKPRWILRRKAQAVLRNKIRSVVSPVSFKI